MENLKNQSTKVENKKATSAKVELKANVSKANEQILSLLVGEKINLQDLSKASVADCISANALLLSYQIKQHEFSNSIFLKVQEYYDISFAPFQVCITEFLAELFITV